MKKFQQLGADKNRPASATLRIIYIQYENIYGSFNFFNRVPFCVLGPPLENEGDRTANRLMV